MQISYQFNVLRAKNRKTHAKVLPNVNLRNLVNGQGKGARIFDLCIQSLIILSLISFSIETLPNLNAQVRFWLQLFEVVVVLIFT